MIEHIIFLFYLIFFIFSNIGYGYLFSRLFYKDFISLNLGYLGLLGFFFLSIISITTSFFYVHDIYFNSIIHVIGFFSFIYLISKLSKFNELKIFSLLFLLFLIGAYVFKNHDDFPYYHLTYSLYLTENSFIVGTGNFSHGFRTFSSLFFYHSLLFLPLIKYFLFHIGPFLILLFSSYLLIQKLILNFQKDEINLSYFFTLLSFIFVGVVFYRIGEHGTDRSAQILLLLIFILFIEIFYFEKDLDQINKKIILLSILIFFASSMKVIYYLYLILIPLIFFKKNFLTIKFFKKSFFIFIFLSLSLILNLMINYLNTGCFLYPAVKTCFLTQDWSLSTKEVERMALHYEWWAKAGGGAGYSSEVPRKIYVENFNWIKDWIDRHFFNKVSDTLFGISFICIFCIIVFFIFSKSKQTIHTNKKYYLIYMLSFFFLLEWFFNHPSMRYGGYVLFGIPLFIFTSSIIEKMSFSKNNLYKCTIFFVALTLVVYNLRNIQRIHKEAKVYNFNLLSSPFFFVENVESNLIIDKDNFKIYTSGDKMCWASKTPCSYNKKLNSKKFLWMNMVFRDDK